MADLDQILERCRRTEAQKADLRREWREALEVYRGNQWAVIHGSVALEHQRADPSQTKGVFNIFQAYANAAATMLVSGVILPQAVALDDDPAEWARANAINALLSYVWSHPSFKVREAAEMAALNAVLTGNGFLFVSWDPLLPGPTFRDPITGEKISFGFPRIDSLSPFHVGWDMTRPLEEAQWAYIVSVVSPQELVERFPEAKGIEPDATLGDTAFGERWGTGRENSEKVGVLVFEYFEKPSRDRPEGLRAVCTRTQMLYTEPWPGLRMPIAHVRLHLRPDSQWGRTPFYDGIRIQWALNRTLSDILDNTSRLNAPSVFVPQGTLQQPISFKPAAKIEYSPKPGLPGPMVQHVPPLPQWAMTLVETLVGEFERITGLHAVVFGMAPFSRVSGRTFSLMLEQIARQYLMPATRLAEALTSAAWSVLELWQRYGPRELSVRIAPDEPEVLVNSEMLESGNIKLTLEPTDLMTLSKQAKLNDLKELVQLGVLDKDRFLEVASSFGSQYMQASPAYLDRAWVRRQIKKIVIGLQPDPPSDFIDVDVALKEIADMMKRADFEMLPDHVRQMVRQYYDAFAALKPAQNDGQQQRTPMINMPPSLTAQGAPPGLDMAEERFVKSISGGV